MKTNNTFVIFSSLLCFLINFVDASLKFKLISDKDKCFFEELFTGSVMMVKWKLTGLDEDESPAAKGILNKIYIYVSNEPDGKILLSNQLNKAKGKFSFHADKEGYYKICVRYVQGWGMGSKELIMGIKINSDNMDEPDITSAIKFQDLDIAHQKVKEILNEGKLINERQKYELTSEDTIAQAQMKNSRSYYIMTVVQFVFVLSVGIYQIYNFKNFLASHNLI